MLKASHERHFGAQEHSLMQLASPTMSFRQLLRTWSMGWFLGAGACG